MQTECNDKGKAEGFSFGMAEVQPILFKVVQTECNAKGKTEGISFGMADKKEKHTFKAKGLKSPFFSSQPKATPWERIFICMADEKGNMRSMQKG